MISQDVIDLANDATTTLEIANGNLVYLPFSITLDSDENLGDGLDELREKCELSGVSIDNAVLEILGYV